MTKKCSTCKIEKGLEGFQKKYKGKSVLKSECRSCGVARMVDYRSRPNNKIKQARNRRGSMLKKYWPGSSITGVFQKYNDLLQEQGGKCYFCKEPPKSGARSLAVDHCHVSGRVRGLLCTYHNKYFVGRHNDESVVKLVKYILKRDI